MLERIRVEAKAGSSFDPVDIIYDAVCNVILRLVSILNAGGNDDEIYKTNRILNLQKARRVDGMLMVAFDEKKHGSEFQ